MTHDFVFTAARRTRQADLSQALTSVNGLSCVSIFIDAEPPRKLQDFSRFSQNLDKNQPPLAAENKLLLWRTVVSDIIWRRL